MRTKWLTGDALKLLPKLKPNSVDVVIADPPYDDYKLINKSIPLCRRVSKGPTFFFMYAENLLNLEHNPHQILFWVKPISTKNTIHSYSRFVEVICAFDLDRSPFLQNTHWSTRSGVFTDSFAAKQRHAYEKPESLVEKLLVVNARPNSLVLDPFAGSGTVERVCERLGHRCISIEIVRRHQ